MFTIGVCRQSLHKGGEMFEKIKKLVKFFFFLGGGFAGDMKKVSFTRNKMVCQVNVTLIGF
jgi:hypothetical protein